MVEIVLGEDVRSVRTKIGMGSNDYLSLWRSINTKAQEICRRQYGFISLKEANTRPAIKQLKDYFANDGEMEDPEFRQLILDALAINGFAAWATHNAIKRNNTKIRKGKQLTQSVGEASMGESSTPAMAAEGTAGRAIFDPIRNV